MKNRRLKRVRVSANILAEILKMAAVDAIPSDGETHSVYYDHNANSFVLFISSNSFDEVEEGSEVPYFGDPVVSKDFINMIRGRK